ncbi:MAG: branched-chain amino acid ABC transporter permease [Armatimonadota bacterium]|nr:branched-chain amino acid ABC transporter permease [Armatimonadota bacterium]MDR7460755.1 branched-chain amino acid ABC transporter permease [Armatimonadota bacterium]MDR7480647.1 branched-chain amino acid ABC transporter permease [Armatimonadota bacterium]MDR7502430.1 branched-chain amino acid ABC transporter permease [Armatimonadota bacterium]MDR7528716.1 branched-chain amino acid ABC transporter permease [Armatimonadota bacterium]
MQFAVNGLFISAAYALVALGLTLIFGVLHIADFAQGALYMLGAYVSFYATHAPGLGYFASVPVAMGLTAALATLNGALVYRPLQRHGGALTFIAALGILLILQNLALWLFGGDFRLIASPFGDGKITVWGVVLTHHQAFVLGVTALLVAAVWFGLRHTKPGKALRAMAQQPEAARLVGIDSARLGLVTFALAGALAGAAGGLISPIRAFDPHIGAIVILKSFAIVIFGGMGSVPGAIVGALLVGMAETFTAAYLAAEFADLVAFALMIVILFARPQGLLGRVPA